MWRRTLGADQLARVLAPFIVTIAHESPNIKIFSIVSRSMARGCGAMILQPRPTGGDGSFLLSQTQVCHPITRGPRPAFTHCAGSGSSLSATLALAFCMRHSSASSAALHRAPSYPRAGQIIEYPCKARFARLTRSTVRTQGANRWSGGSVSATILIQLPTGQA